MFTGPGRPVRSRPNACFIASGSISTRVGWKDFFTSGRMTDGKSPWKYRPVSWNGMRLNCVVGTLPVIARNDEESIIAPASATGRLHDPGPDEVNVTTGWCFTL